MTHLQIEKIDSISIVKVNRPEALNALNEAVLLELRDFLTQDDSRVLILTGAGDKAFVAGADIKAMEKMDQSEIEDFCELGHSVMNLLDHGKQATIAAVNGYALGGGLELALACDFAFASRNAKLGLPEVTLGIIPGFGGTQRLSRAVGTRKAKEMILTGKPVKAEEAEKIGLVNRVCDPEKLLEECLDVAKLIAGQSPAAIAQAKRVINEGADAELREALELEKQSFVECFATPERKAAMQAFLS